MGGCGATAGEGGGVLGRVCVHLRGEGGGWLWCCGRCVCVWGGGTVCVHLWVVGGCGASRVRCTPIPSSLLLLLAANHVPPLPCLGAHQPLCAAHVRPGPPPRPAGGPPCGLAPERTAGAHAALHGRPAQLVPLQPGAHLAGGPAGRARCARCPHRFAGSNTPNSRVMSS